MKSGANAEVNASLKSKTAFFIGDDQINRSSLNNLSQKLERTIDTLIKKEILYFGCAGLSEFGLLSVRAIMNARTKNPAIKMILILPYKQQYKIHTRLNPQDYDKILKDADKVVHVSEKHSPDCYRKHILHLLKHSGVCVAYVKHTQRETQKIVELARNEGLEIVLI